MSATKTWADIERAALNDAVLYHGVMAVQTRRATREEALCALVLWLAEDRRVSLAREVDRLSSQPRAPFTVQP